MVLIHGLTKKIREDAADEFAKMIKKGDKLYIPFALWFLTEGYFDNRAIYYAFNLKEFDKKKKVISNLPLIYYYFEGDKYFPTEDFNDRVPQDIAIKAFQQK